MPFDVKPQLQRPCRNHDAALRDSHASAQGFQPAHFARPTFTPCRKVILDQQPVDTVRCLEALRCARYRYQPLLWSFGEQLMNGREHPGHIEVRGPPFGKSNASSAGATCGPRPRLSTSQPLSSQVDVLALDLRGDASLLTEPTAEVVAVEELRVHDLERTAALGLEVNDLVDGAHATGSNAAEDAITVSEEEPDHGGLSSRMMLTGGMGTTALSCASENLALTIHGHEESAVRVTVGHDFDGPSTHGRQGTTGAWHS